MDFLSRSDPVRPGFINKIIEACCAQCYDPGKAYLVMQGKKFRNIPRVSGLLRVASLHEWD